MINIMFVEIITGGGAKTEWFLYSLSCPLKAILCIVTDCREFHYLLVGGAKSFGTAL